MSPRKDAAIQSLRGLAVLLMVAGHVIGSESSRGLQVSDDSLWRLFYVGLEDLRMPLFTVISGFVYALRPVSARSGYAGLVRGKVRRLLVPLLTVGALLFLMQSVIPGVNHRPGPRDVWRIYLYQYEHLWFLQAIFLVFVIVGLLDSRGRLARIGSWGVALGAACAVYVLVLIPGWINLFSANGAIRLLPFFLFGLGLRRFAGTLDRQQWMVWSLPAFAVVYALRLASGLGFVQLPHPAGRALALAVGLTGLLTLFVVRNAVRVRILERIGEFSFGIYLLHVFGAAAMRIALERLGVVWNPALFVLCLGAGVALPIAFELTAGRVPMVGRLVLGAGPRRSGTPASTEPAVHHVG